MHHPQHAILSGPDGVLSPKRAVSIGFVAALHVVAIWALVSGLAQRALRYIPPTLEASVITAPTSPAKPIAVPKPALVTPPQAENAVLPPEFTVDAPSPDAITTTPAEPSPPVADSAASGLSSTHTTPPYPGDARRLGEQGTVRLHLAISAGGTVTGAQIVTSSGFPDLDQTAASWVVAHWKYKPAILNGVPVASAADANVVFDLKHAR